jgi:drug/metabolite transporter (DMT)-like permease
MDDIKNSDKNNNQQSCKQEKSILVDDNTQHNTPSIMSYVRLVTCIILWGGIYHVAKYLVSKADIYTVSSVRFFLSALILLILFVANKKHNYKKCHQIDNSKIFKFSKSQWIILFYVGFVGIFCYSLFFFSAENNIPAVTVAILYAFTPCITVLLNRVFFQHRLSIHAYLGIIIAFIGTIVVILSSSHTHHTQNLSTVACASSTVDHTWGIVAAILASISMAVYSILNRKAALMELDSLTITTFSIVIGAVLLIVVFLFFGAPLHLLLTQGWKFWAAMFYIVVLGTVLCYKWYSDAIKHIGVGKTAVFLNGVPLSAVIIGAMLGKSLSLLSLAGGAAIIIGVIITNFAVSNR